MINSKFEMNKYHFSNSMEIDPFSNPLYKKINVWLPGISEDDWLSQRV